MSEAAEQKIRVRRGGCLMVTGGIPLVRKAPVVTEHGEPIAWKRGETIQTEETYFLCRCGNSSNKPFCDGTHKTADWDPTEAAPTGAYADRAKPYEGTGIVVRDDRGICTHAGFCGLRDTNVWKMAPKTDDTQMRSLVAAMVERCPSGALTYELDGAPVEPDLPREIALTPDGPLWVTGGITVERSDGEPLEVRNRMTLCRCGLSKRKPLCDGSHKEAGFRAP